MSSPDYNINDNYNTMNVQDGGKGGDLSFDNDQKMARPRQFE